MTIELPEVPEGFFWRVGEVTTYYGPALAETKVPAVLLMERVYTHSKPDKDTFNRAVEGKPGNWVVERCRLNFGTAFYAPKEKDIPSFAVRSEYKDYAKAYYYSVGMDAEGIRHLAESVLKTYHEIQEEDRKYEEEERKKQEAKDRFYGDYPPKTLEGK